MVVNLKIYKFSDPDMYALHNAHISVPALMKLAIAYRARGKRLRIFVPDCLYCDLSGQKRHIPLKITIRDKVSIEYLRTALKEGSRTANIKIILRDCMMEQITGPTIRNRQLVLAENARLMLEAEDHKKDNDILILPPGTSRRSYYPMIRNRTIELPEEKEGRKRSAAVKTAGKETAPRPVRKEANDVNVPKPVDAAKTTEDYMKPPVDTSVLSPEGQEMPDDGGTKKQESPEAAEPWDGNVEEMTDEEADEDFFSQFESLG